MRIDDGAFDLGPTSARVGVLCLHGLTGTPYEVRPPALALAADGHHCVGPLLPGHGETPLALSRTSYRAWVEVVEAACDALSEQHDRVYVLGLSMGGVLALHLGASRSVAGLVVLAAPLRLGLAVRASVPWLRRLVRFVPKTPAIEDPIARSRHPGYDRMPLDAVRELMELQRQVAAQLGQVRAPVRLIYSRRDPSVRPGEAGRILRGLASPDRSVVWLERSRHVLPVDLERERVSNEVVDFLRRLERH
ncbi:MAG: alpha/beta hydrolase [Myxococcota bacterium]